MEKAIDTEMVEQPGGDICQIVEGVVELVHRGHGREPVTDVVRGDHVITVGQCRDEIPEHVRTARESVQEYEDWRVARAGLLVEDFLAVDGRCFVVYGEHVNLRKCLSAYGASSPPGHGPQGIL